MSNDNGKTEETTENLSLSGKIDLILDMVSDLKDQQDELIEKLSNLSLPGSDFEAFEDN